MRKIALWTVLVLSFFAGEAYAAVEGAPLPKNERPVLITRLGGVSSEVREQAEQAVKNHGGRLRLKARNENDANGRTVMARPQASDLATGGYRTMVVMVGSYMEEGLDPVQDGRRLEGLLNEAKALRMRVVVIHLERPNGQGGTPTLDTGRLDLLLKHTDQVVAMKSGDAINTHMIEYARKNGVALSTLDSPRDLMQNASRQQLRMKQN